MEPQLSLPACGHHCPVDIIRVEMLSQNTSCIFYFHRHPQVLCTSSNVFPGRALRDIYCLHPFPALGGLVGHLLAFLEGLKATACYPRMVHEDVFIAVVW